jgi:hypothetical protein
MTGCDLYEYRPSLSCFRENTVLWLLIPVEQPHLYYISSTVSVVIFLWIPTTNGDTVSCLGGGDDTAWLFGSEYSVSLWDETARGLHARSFAGFFSFATTRFGTIPYRDKRLDTGLTLFEEPFLHD